ncbi:MAG: prephenate dehydrogenase [Chloroflexi bacterium]|nr:prephenate dehydrogenase [Chloroflexota bacterium]
MKKHIAIIGLGLIGGSIGLALKRSGLENAEVTGYARNPEVASKALRLRAVDKIGESLTSTVGKADIVILATPTMAIKDILEQIGPHLISGCIVTDTASTKTKVMEWAEQYLPSRVNFIGGHPMAGKESAGIDVAEANLFQGRTYCLVPGRNSSPASIQLMVELVGKMGANPLFITALEHDNFVAGISHLPFILSSTLVMATTKSPVWKKMSGLAATGYRDVTRLASQHPRMNRDICLTNRENILLWIDEFSRELSRFRQLVADNSEDMEKAFMQARQARESWLEDYDKRD